MICATALVLLMDVSGSIDDSEYRQQIQGTAQAFRDPGIQNIITRQGPVAVSVVLFSTTARTLIGWRVLRTRQEMQAFATEIEGINRPFAFSTNLLAGLNASLDLLESAPCEAENRIVDVSGDGPHDGTGNIEEGRDRAIRMGVRINALAIADPEFNTSEYFRNHVATPGGLVVGAYGYEHYAYSIRAKITLELAGWPRR